MAVEFKDVRKVFPDGTIALDRFNLTFDEGEFIVLLGPSGSGKTTACRIMAGLEEPSGGSVWVGGRDITQLPPRQRNMSMVFQNYALYAHRSVYDNIAYPLKVRHVERSQIDSRVRETASMLDISALLDRRPRQLSGGEAQRVAVARALVWQPEICLMDEPLSNLDALLRLQTRTELKRLYSELGTTFVFVTHDQEEAMTLGTRIAVLKEGRLIQFDTPREIYRRPTTRFVAEFIGRPAMNTIEGEIRDGIFRAASLSVPAAGRPEGPIVLGARPEQLVLSDSQGAGAGLFSVDVVEEVEPDTLIFLKNEGIEIVVRALREVEELAPGTQVQVTFPEDGLHFFDRETGKRIP